MRARALWLFPAVAILFSSSFVHAVPMHQWSKRFGDFAVQEGHSVVMDGLGNVIVAGYFRGTVNFGGGLLTSAGRADIFVAKFDAYGNHLWSRRYGDVSSDVGNSVAVDGSNNLVLTGYFQGTVDFGGGPLTSAGGGEDIFVAKLDGNGNHIWSRAYGDDGAQEGSSIDVDFSGNGVITGFSFGSVDFGGGPLVGTGMFVASFDANGNHLYSLVAVAADASSGSQGKGVAIDDSGNVVVTGTFSGTVDFGGGPFTSSGTEDIFVAKFDLNGSHLWSHQFGDNHSQILETDIGNSVAVDGSGNVVIVGNFNGTTDFGGGPLTSAGAGDLFVARFDANGNHLWSKSFGTLFDDDANSVATNAVGEIVVTGFVDGIVDFGGGPLANEGIYIAKFGADGSHESSQTYNGGVFSVLASLSVAMNDPGDVVITGYFVYSVDFGGGLLTSEGGEDIFLAKFGEAPLTVLITSFGAKPRNGAVEVTWDVWNDEALESFTLYRRDEAHPTAIVVAEGSFVHDTRSYVDANVAPGKAYQYELVIHTRAGDDIRSQTAAVTMPEFKGTLRQNFPNPFRPATTIEYTLGEPSSVVLGIYDAAGRLVVRLDQGVREAGTHHAEWNGRDGTGRVAGSGVYFYRLEGAPRVAPRKMVRLK